MGLLDLFRKIFGTKEGGKYKAKQASNSASFGAGSMMHPVHHSRFKQGRKRSAKNTRRKKK